MYSHMQICLKNMAYVHRLASGKAAGQVTFSRRFAELENIGESGEKDSVREREMALPAECWLGMYPTLDSVPSNSEDRTRRCSTLKSSPRKLRQ